MVIRGGAGTILRSRMTPFMEKAYIDTLTIAQRTGYGILQKVAVAQMPSKQQGLQ